MSFKLREESMNKVVTVDMAQLRMRFISVANDALSRLCATTAIEILEDKKRAGLVCSEYDVSQFKGDHVAIVEHPMDKRCYVSRQREPGGPWIDRLTGEQTPVENDEKEEEEKGLRFSGIIMTHRLPVGAIL